MARMGEDLRRRLRESAEEPLLALLREHAGELGPEDALQALANPFLTAAGVELLAAQGRVTAAYEVRRALAMDRRTPEILARRFLGGLYWHDLVAAGADMRLAPLLRRAADLLLATRLPGLSPGEKMAVARRASLGLVAHFRDEANPRVLGALLENPRMTEGALLPLLHRERVPPAVLEVVANDPRWGVRYPIRLALARNPSTPVQIALRTLPHLRKSDLVTVARDLRLAAAVRRRAQLLGGLG